MLVWVALPKLGPPWTHTFSTLTITKIDHVMQESNLGLRGPRFQLLGFHVSFVWNHRGDVHIQLAPRDLSQQFGWEGVLSKFRHPLLCLDILTPGMVLVQLFNGQKTIFD